MVGQQRLVKVILVVGPTVVKAQVQQKLRRALVGVPQEVRAMVSLI